MGKSLNQLVREYLENFRASINSRRSSRNYAPDRDEATRAGRSSAGKRCTRSARAAAVRSFAETNILVCADDGYDARKQRTAIEPLVELQWPVLGGVRIVNPFAGAKT